MSEVVLIVGYPASGKTTYTLENFPSHFRLNRDQEGGTLKQLAKKLEQALQAGKTEIVLDNTFGTKESREPFISLAKKYGIPAKVKLINTTIEDAQFNAVYRMVKKYKKLLDNTEATETKDDNCFSINVLFHYRKTFQKPELDEGLDEIEVVPFERQIPKDYKNKALVLDYDGTLRKTKSGSKYPVTPDDVEILPGRKEILDTYKDQGYLLIGVSNQSGVADKKLSLDDAIACFDRTNELLGHEIDYSFCPHSSYPPQCYCRKPQVGLGVLNIIKYKLDPAKCIMVGDLTSDKTFAKKAGFNYKSSQEFFEEKI